ncbi:unnamed protein product [Porites lobata]|uniref:Fluorescent protein n=1 Tax=Porites lobata TaxID=104759 RepID=A0ABN8RU80_9CNID|nr:unnamed protein product [Porites lobata]
MALSKQVIKDDMAMTYHMEGSVDGHFFTIEGEGSGKPYEAFTDYPKGIVDYFKPSFPDGYTWEQSLQFEDGGSCIANVDISSFYFDSLDSKRNCFIHKSTFTGMNFPADGPVMQKEQLIGSLPSRK